MLSSMFQFSRKLLKAVKDNTVSHTDFLSTVVRKPSSDPSTRGDCFFYGTALVGSVKKN